MPRFEGANPCSFKAPLARPFQACQLSLADFLSLRSGALSVRKISSKLAYFAGAKSRSKWHASCRPIVIGHPKNEP
jgi:hypothetical protein